VFLTFRQLK